MKDLSQINAKVVLQYKNTIGVVIIAAICLFSTYGVFKDYKNSLARIAEEREGLGKTKEKIKVWKQLKTQYENLRKSFLGNDPLVFNKYVERMARNSEIRIISSKTSNIQKDFYQQASIKLEVLSGYKELSAFISKLEQKGIFLDYLYLRIIPNEGLKANMELKTVLVKK